MNWRQSARYSITLISFFSSHISFLLLQTRQFHHENVALQGKSRKSAECFVEHFSKPLSPVKKCSQHLAAQFSKIKKYCVHAIQAVQISVQYLKKKTNPVQAATTTRSARIGFNVLPNNFFDNRETRIPSNVLLAKVLISNFTIFTTLLLIKTVNWKSLIVNR